MSFKVLRESVRRTTNCLSIKFALPPEGRLNSTWKRQSSFVTAEKLSDNKNKSK